MSAAAQVPARMLSYWLRSTSVQQQDGAMQLFDRLYLGVTNRAPCATLVAQRGPGFAMPARSGFGAVCETLQTLEARHERVSATDLVEQVDYAFLSKRIQVSSMESDPITFAGLGDPLLEMGVVAEACAAVREKRHGQQFRLMTHGLVPAAELGSVVELLKASMSKSCVCASERASEAQ